MAFLGVATLAAPSSGSAAAPGTSSAAAITVPPGSVSLPGPNFDHAKSLGYGLRVPVYDSAHPPTQANRAQLRQKVPTAEVRAKTQAFERTNALQAVGIQGAHSRWIVNYLPDPNGHTFSPAAQAAFTRAVTTWANQVYSPVPITVNAYWTDLTAAYGDGGILGSAGPTSFWESDPGHPDNTVYPVAMVNSFLGEDADPGVADIDAAFNSGFTYGGGWYYGTGTPLPTQEDLQSVITHELGHGLGFISSFGQGLADGCPSDYVGCRTDVPFVFDRFLTTGASGGTSLVNYQNNSTQLAAVENSNNVYWNGTWAQVWGGFVRPRMYFPSVWQPGSSGSHLDEDTYPASSGNALMTPYLTSGEVERTIGHLTAGMMLDMGWTHEGVAAAFVRAAYQDFLGRAAKTSEVRAVVNVLQNGGMTHRQEALNLARSREWLTRIITQFYETVLGREPDAAGLANWINAIRSGQMTVTQTAAAFYGSNEYFTSGAGSNPRTWVTHLYAAILGRTAASSEIDFWVFQASHIGRRAVAIDIYQSYESRSARVTALYQHLLSRAPDSSGLATWTNQLRVQDDLVLASSLAGSVEYSYLATGRYLFA